MKKLYFTFACLLFAVCPAAFARTNPVLEWNSALLNAARKNDTPSVLIARNFALLHLALAKALLSPTSDAVDAKTSQILLSDDEMLAGVWAACDVASSLYPSSRTEFERLRAAECSEFQAGDRSNVGRERGHRIARDLLEERRDDGVATSLSYVPKTEPGQWRRTPPFFRPPELPQWGATVKPLVLERADQFRPAGPPPMNSPAYADAVRQTQTLGRKDSSVRTEDQTAMARFWSDFSYTEMPVGHWNSIARELARSRGLGVRESARLFVLLDLAMADTGVACWDAKFHYNAWRPVTAIPRAAEMHNPTLSADSSWQPLLVTPAHPEYPSGHSAFSGAATSILAHFFGTDAIAFDVRSDTLPDQHRQFTGFKMCADECSLSRVYGGIHFPFACADGLTLGRQVGDNVWERMQAAPFWAERKKDKPIATQKGVAP